MKIASRHIASELPKSRQVSSETVLTALRETLSQVPEVAFAYLFGSAAQGKDFRDLDVALYLIPCPSSPYERFKLAMRIGRLLERSLQPRCEVDVRVLNEAPILFRGEVLRTGRLLIERLPERFCYFSLGGGGRNRLSGAKSVGFNQV